MKTLSPNETSHNVETKGIEEKVYDSMSRFYGTHNLSFISCLFNQMESVLGIKNGEIHMGDFGVNEIEKVMHQNRIYGHYGNPKSLLHTDLPPEFNLFVIGPGDNDKTLKIICSAPEINARDLEEREVINYINSDLALLMGGKHQDIYGDILLYKDVSTDKLERISLLKKFHMPVKPTFSFEKDLRDIKKFGKIYQEFFDYQKQRDELFKDTASKIIQNTEKRLDFY